MAKTIFLVISITCFAQIFGQENSVDQIKKLFDDFNYAKVIEKSNSMLTLPNLDSKDLVIIHLLRAQSFYSLYEDEMTRKSFRELLKINKLYELDKSVISPKLISIFNEVRSEIENSDNELANNTEELNKQIKQAEENKVLLKSAVIKNIVLPGWGQLQLGGGTKGWVLSGLSAASLFSMLYYISDSNKKQDIYLKESNKALMDEKYSAYNSSYKLRNVSIFIYAAIWIYSQIDLIFFNNESRIIPQAVSVFSLGGGSINLSYGIPLN